MLRTKWQPPPSLFCRVCPTSVISLAQIISISFSNFDIAVNHCASGFRDCCGWAAPFHAANSTCIPPSKIGQVPGSVEYKCNTVFLLIHYIISYSSIESVLIYWILWHRSLSQMHLIFEARLNCAPSSHKKYLRSFSFYWLFPLNEDCRSNEYFMGRITPMIQGFTYKSLGKGRRLKESAIRGVLLRSLEKRVSVSFSTSIHPLHPLILFSFILFCNSVQPCLYLSLY